MDTARGRGPARTSRSAQHGRSVLPRRLIRRDDEAVSSNVGTVLLVIITVAMVAVIGAYVFGMVQVDRDPPQVGIVVTSQVGRMHAHINDVSESRPLDEFRLIARYDNGTMVMYDSDGDAIADTALAMGLEELTVSSAAGPLSTPMVYVDSDGNDLVSTGDYFTYRHPFYAPLNPLIDVTHGYKIVGTAPNGIPRDSMLLVVASEDTLPGASIQPGDPIRFVIGKGGTVYHQEDGYAAMGNYWTATIDIPVAWSPATYAETEFIVRPGEADEFRYPYPIKILPENPPSKAEKAYWEWLNNPMEGGTSVVLVHEPSNQIVLEFTV